MNVDKINNDLFEALLNSDIDESGDDDLVEIGTTENRLREGKITFNFFSFNLK